MQRADRTCPNRGPVGPRKPYPIRLIPASSSSLPSPISATPTTFSTPPRLLHRPQPQASIRDEGFTSARRGGGAMDRYQRVEKPREEAAIGANEIRITAQGRTRNYITYALALLQDNATDEIVIKAMGRAINKTVAIVELLKRRIAGLHQNNSIESIDITDTWEPLEEGLNILETTRHVSLITVILSKKELDTSSPGYQPPIPADQVRPPTDFDQDAEDLPSGRVRGRGRRGRGRGRGFSNGGVDYDDENGDLEGPRGYRGRGRGRGRRGSFGPGRGYGGDGYVMEEAGGYHGVEHNAPPVQGYEGDRGRGRGRDRGRGRGRGGGLGHGPPPQE